MLKSLFPNIDWNSIRVVGFDLDGTLYDELDFITQVYKPISEYLAKVCSCNPSGIYNWMVRRWLEKGSSYNRIFCEVLINRGVEQNAREVIISKCVEIYRSFKPNLTLPKRSCWLLDLFAEEFHDLFLVTDGSVSLQLAKIETLGLLRWFKTENIVITGAYGKEYYKPSVLSVGKIKVLRGISPHETVFWGDREVDEQFSNNAGFHFINVKCLDNMKIHFIT
ncbi:MAG TPA: HAD family hydrolase [Clostridia bacterium]|nr:HAD family hydrolase [Clostridia bacterium]